MATSVNAVLVNFVPTGTRTEFVDFKIRSAANSVDEADVDDAENVESYDIKRNCEIENLKNQQDIGDENNRKRTSSTWPTDDTSSSSSESNADPLPINFRQSDVNGKSPQIDHSSPLNHSTAIEALRSNSASHEDISADRNSSYFRSKHAFCDSLAPSNTTDDSVHDDPTDLSMTSSSSSEAKGSRVRCEAIDTLSLHRSLPATSAENTETMEDGYGHMTSQTAKRLSSLTCQRPTKRRKLVEVDNDDDQASGTSNVCWTIVGETHRLNLEKELDAIDRVNSSSTRHQINKSTCFSITDILRPEFGYARSTSPSDSPSGSPSSVAEDLRSQKTRASDLAHTLDVTVSDNVSAPSGGFSPTKCVNSKRHRPPCPEQRQPSREVKQLPVPPTMELVGKDLELISRFQRQQQHNSMLVRHNQRPQQQQQHEIQLQIEHHLRQQQAAIRLHHEQQQCQQHSSMVAASTTASALIQQQNGIPMVNPYAAFYAAAIAAAAAAAAVQGSGMNVTTETGNRVSTTVHEASGNSFVRLPVPVGNPLSQPPSSNNANTQRNADDGRCRLPGTIVDRFVAAGKGVGLMSMLSNNNNTNKTNLNDDEDYLEVKNKFGMCTDRFDADDDVKDRRILSRMQNSSGKQTQQRCTTAKRQPPGDGQTFLRQPPSHPRKATAQNPAQVADVSNAHLHQQHHDQALSITCSEISDSCVQSHSSSLSTTSSTEMSQSEHQSRPEQESSHTGNRSLAPLPWPAWVYCTRYSDRPSSGPRSRKPKKKDAMLSPSSADDKRPRTAFTASQLDRLRDEFDASKYLNEDRRLSLARELDLNESQIKIWFQNKRAKMKKASGVRNQLALQLMAQGLYNHSSSSSSSSGGPIQHQAPLDATSRH